MDPKAQQKDTDKAEAAKKEVEKKEKAKVVVPKGKQAFEASGTSFLPNPFPSSRTRNDFCC